METRLLLQSLSEEVYIVNKSYESKDKEENQTHYKQYRDVLASLMLLGAKVITSEVWESGFVVLEVSVEGVKY